MSDTVSGWHIIHDFFKGWGLRQPSEDVGLGRVIWLWELEAHDLNHLTATVGQIEAIWPEVEKAREEAQAAARERMKGATFDSITLPKIKGGYPDFDIMEALSVKDPLVDEVRELLAGAIPHDPDHPITNIFHPRIVDGEEPS